MLYLIVYLFDFYGNFINTLITLFIATIAIGAVIGINASGDYEHRNYNGDNDYFLDLKDNYHKCIKTIKTLSKVALVLGLSVLFLPSKQGLAMLGGVYVGSQVYDSLDKSAITQKAIKVLNQELDGYLDSMLKEEETKK